MPKTRSLQEEMLRQRYAGMSKEELVKQVKQLRDEQQQRAASGPQNDDELHEWLRLNLGIDIPRVAVCVGHQAPFEFIAAVYFCRTTNAIAVGARDSGKTVGAAVLHYLRGRFSPGIETTTVGAVEQQSRRAYAHLQRFLDKPVSKGLVDPRARTMSETRWKNGSKTEVLPGSTNSVNGPHPQLMHADEVELMDEEVFEESQNCPSAMKLSDGNYIPAQYIITSTRKRAFGPMARLVKQVQDAKAHDTKAPYDLFVWCVYEVAQNVPNCKAATGCTSEDGCPCHEVVNGEWENGDQRTLESCCRGRLAKSQGYVPLSDVIRGFLTIPRTVWEAQNECLRPQTLDLVLPNMTRERYGIKEYEPDPANGPIIMSWDPGGTHAHAVIWMQYLKVDLDVMTPGGNTKRLKAGSRVVFDEIYQSEIANTVMGKKVLRREDAWKDRYRDFKPMVRVADIRAKAARLDWEHLNPELRTIFQGTKDVKAQIDHVRDDLVDMDFLWADVDRCPNFWEEASMWHYPRKKAGMLDDPELPVEDADHAMAALRYACNTLKDILRNEQRGLALPRASSQGYGAAFSDGALPAMPRSQSQNFASERWRENLGAPLTPSDRFR